MLLPTVTVPTASAPQAVNALAQPVGPLDPAKTTPNATSAPMASSRTAVPAIAWLVEVAASNAALVAHAPNANLALPSAAPTANHALSMPLRNVRLASSFPALLAPTVTLPAALAREPLHLIA